MALKNAQMRSMTGSRNPMFRNAQQAAALKNAQMRSMTGSNNPLIRDAMLNQPGAAAYRQAMLKSASRGPIVRNAQGVQQRNKMAQYRVRRGSVKNALSMSRSAQCSALMGGAVPTAKHVSMTPSASMIYRQ